MLCSQNVTYFDAVVTVQCTLMLCSRNRFNMMLSSQIVIYLNALFTMQFILMPCS
jgi:hypothetical protein